MAHTVVILDDEKEMADSLRETLELASYNAIAFTSVRKALDYIKDKSGREANPVANALLELGHEWFIYAKCGIVALSLVFLLVHKTFRYVNAALWALVSFYGLLLVYHIYLQLEYYFGHPM